MKKQQQQREDARAVTHEAAMVMQDKALLDYYAAIERASEEMLDAARCDWDRVAKLEGASAVLISQLKHPASSREPNADEARAKSKVMRRILVNDAQIRNLAEPWLEDLDRLLAGTPKLLH